MNPIRRRFIACAFLCASSVPPLSAQQPAQLTLADAVARGLRADPGLEIALAEHARARSNVRETQASRQPSLAVDASLTRYAEPMIVAPLHRLDPARLPSFDRTLTQSSATLAYTIFDATRGGRIERAQAMASAAQMGERAARMQLLSNVAQLYLRLRSARELAAASASRVTALQRERTRAAQLVEQGKAARVLLLRAEAALSAAQAESVSAASNADIAANELARELGMTADSLRLMQLKDVQHKRPPEMDVAALRAAARDSNPELERARRQLSAAEAGRNEARGLKLPRFQAGGRVIDYGSTKTSPQIEWQGGVFLSYALLTGGTRGAAIDRASAELRAARAQYELVERRVDEAVERAAAAVSAAHARIAALEAGVTQSLEVTRIDRLALEAGAGVQTDYLTAEADLFRARAALTDARATELIALIELARVTGQLSERWLAENVESYQ